jgi:DNA end-binding protein Ku
VTDEDLEKVPLRTVRAIEIERFVPASELASMRFVKQAYYVEPEPLGRKAFGLLKDVLADKGLTAICKVVITNREHLAALDPFGDTMLLSTLYWPDEIRSAEDLELGEEAAVRPVERAMAEQLVAAMTDTFDPAAYRDDYRDALMTIIEAKVAGEERFEAPAEQPAATVVDLMAALEASVAAARASRAAQPVAGAIAGGASADEDAGAGAASTVPGRRGTTTAKAGASVKGERRRKTA